jgi:hypothetical protein
VELLTQILTDGGGDRLECGQIAQGLVTFKQGQQRQLLRVCPRMGRNKRPFLLSRCVQRLEFLCAQRSFESRVSLTFDGGHGSRL